MQNDVMEKEQPVKQPEIKEPVINKLKKGE